MVEVGRTVERTLVIAVGLAVVLLSPILFSSSVPVAASPSFGFNPAPVMFGMTLQPSDFPHTDSQQVTISNAGTNGWLLFTDQTTSPLSGQPTDALYVGRTIPSSLQMQQGGSATYSISVTAGSEEAEGQWRVQLNFEVRDTLGGPVVSSTFLVIEVAVLVTRTGTTTPIPFVDILTVAIVAVATITTLALWKLKKETP